MAYTATYSIADYINIAIDIGAKFMAALSEQAGNLGNLIVVALILVIVIDYITGVFGIFRAFRGGMRK